MDEILLLSDDLQRKSLARDEIVLPYAEALNALTILEEAGCGILGWEPWLKSPDGLHLHPSMGGSFEREKGEDWITYVQRSVRHCRRILQEEQFHWDQGTFPGSHSALILHFCLITANEEDWDKLKRLTLEQEYPYIRPD